MKRFDLYLPEWMREKLDEVAADSGMSAAMYIRVAVQEKFDREEVKGVKSGSRKKSS